MKKAVLPYDEARKQVFVDISVRRVIDGICKILCILRNTCNREILCQMRTSDPGHGERRCYCGRSCY